MSDQERNGVCTLGVDLFLRVDASIHECLHNSIDVIDEVLVIEHYVVS